MSENFRIDSHKLIYHPERVGQWLESHMDWEKAKLLYPIYIEASPAGGCNHRCSFCAMDYIGYKNRMFDLDIWDKTTTVMAEKKVKSIMLAGEGEPFLNKDAGRMAAIAKEKNIDVAFSTNGVLMDGKQSDVALPVSSWIKVSIDAGNAATYAAIRKTKESDFSTLFKNLEYAVNLKHKNGYECTLGAQMILLPENHTELTDLARLCRDTGLDYLVIKPYSQHLHSHNKTYENLTYNQLISSVADAEQMGTDTFRVIFRKQAFGNLQQGNSSYKHCLSIPFFWTHFMANHDVYACSSHIMNETFLLGNLKETSFQEIWEGEKRKHLFHAMKSFDVSECRMNCRMTFINDYLWELTHPKPHVNFI